MPKHQWLLGAIAPSLGNAPKVVLAAQISITPWKVVIQRHGVTVFIFVDQIILCEARLL